MGRWLVVLVTLGACGRVAFDALPDAQIDGPPIVMRDDCVGYETALFCDGFEDPALPKWNSGGQVVSMQLDMPKPPHGARVLQSDTQTTQDASFVLAKVGPFTSGTLFARAWIFVPSNITLTHFDFFDVNSDGFGGVAVFVFRNNLTLFQGTASPSSAVMGPPLPVDRWMCIEIELQIADPGNVSVSLDGNLAASFTGIDLLPGTGYANLMTGIPWTDDGQTQARAYSDEIILDTKPIPCD